MKRLFPLVFLLAACAPVVFVPRPVVVAIPPGEAVRIAMNFARQQGLNPLGVRWDRLDGGGRFWDILLTLGPPSCGVDRIHVGHWDGRVYGSRPAIYACGAYYPEPLPPTY